MKQKTYIKVDHACRECGGRILQQTNPGATGGGNPVFECADCDRACCGMDSSAICWCGFSQRGQYQTGDWFCISLEEQIKKPWVSDALAHCGVDPQSRKVKVAMVNREMLKICEQRYLDRQNATIARI